MPKEIKIRVWDSVTKEMSQPSSLSIFSEEQVDVFAFTFLDKNGHWLLNGNIPTDSLLKNRFIFQEFTGLFDKNNKEIYEGDIVSACRLSPNSCFKRTYEVKFEEGSFNVGNPAKIYSLAMIYEVMGNIFENPELI